MKIYLDPGHGGQDSGETANGILEKNINLSVALKLKPLLEAGGITVMLSRSTDVFPSLNERPSQANSWGADFFMSIHHNGGKGIGYEIYRSIRSDASLTFAQTIAAQYEKIGRKPHGGGVQTKIGSDSHDYYAVIRGANMAAILSEYCYLDSSDVTAIDSELKQVAEAQAIASGIFAHLGISPAQPQQTPVNIVAAVAPTGDPVVKAYQAKLNRLHIGTPLAVDGQNGIITKGVVRAFQTVCGIAIDGVWGTQCEAAYQAIVSKPTLTFGSTGLAVRYIQYRLGIAFDGQFGTNTKGAVQMFQHTAGLVADGVLGSLTWAKLIG